VQSQALIGAARIHNPRVVWIHLRYRSLIDSLGAPGPRDRDVDVPRGAAKYDRERDCPQRNCIVEAVTWYLNVLKSKDSPLAEKQLALDYLVHLVGDLHQPLHVGFLDDVGGTKTKVTLQGKAQTLHELWDTGMLETEKGTAQAMAKLLDEGLSTDDQTAWQTGTPTDWVNESLALTIEYVYPLRFPIRH